MNDTQAQGSWLIGDHVSHSFPNELQDGPLNILDDVTINVAKGEIAALVGPSGCGKSTLFSILAGLVHPVSGNVSLGHRDVTGTTGHVAYMMQRDLLLPWRTVLENVTLGLELTGTRRSTAQDRALPLMDKFGLSGFEDFYPGALSGGMRQRASFMRTVLSGKNVLLLDEPFGALDALTRSQLHEWLLGIWTEYKNTILFVTHDPAEAVFLADRIYVLSARPAHVKEVVTVELPRPRSHYNIGSSDFARLERKVLSLLWQEKIG